jgi:hypothetical protein
MVEKIIEKKDQSIVLAIGHVAAHDDSGHYRQEPMRVVQYGS